MSSLKPPACFNNRIILMCAFVLGLTGEGSAMADENAMVALGQSGGENPNIISLAGTWEIRMHKTSAGIGKKWFVLSDSIDPGRLATNDLNYNPGALQSGTAATNNPFADSEPRGTWDDLEFSFKAARLETGVNPKKSETPKANPDKTTQVAILKDCFKSEKGQSSPEYIASLLNSANISFSFINSKQLADQKIFGTGNFDLVILPYGPTFPGMARDNFISFLKQGGSYISTGGYAFDNLTVGGIRNFYSIPDPGFESAPEDWTKNCGSGVTIERDTREKHNGATSLRIFAPHTMDLAWNIVSRKLTYSNPGDYINASVYLKTKDIRGTVGAYMTIGFFREDDSKISDRRTDFGRGTSDWSLQSLSGEIPAGTAYSRINLVLYGTGQANFDDLTITKSPKPINTTMADAHDFVEFVPEQIGVFDPDYLLENVKSLRLSKRQNIVGTDIDEKGDFKGYAAFGVTGDRWECFLSQDRSRFIPLIDSYDKFGRERGAAAAMMPHYRGMYKGSVWAFFGIDNEDLFTAQRPVFGEALMDIVKSIKRKTYIHETQPEFHLYRQGEEVRISTKVTDFGEKPHDLELTVEILTFEGDQLVFTSKKNIRLAPGQTLSEHFCWNPGNFDSDIYQVKTAISENGKTIDSEDTSGFVVWNEKIATEREKISLENNYFKLEGKPTFMIGAQQGWITKSLRNGSVITMARDFKAMRDYGLRISRSFMNWTVFPAEKEQRYRDAMVYLCQKYGVVMFFEGISTLGKNNARWLQRAKDVAERYRDIPLMLIDLQNEPSMPLSTPLSGKWGHVNNYERILEGANLFRSWAKTLAAKIHDSDPERLVSIGFLQGGLSSGTLMDYAKDAVWATEGLDFNNRHYFGENLGFPAQFKELDMRYKGVPTAIGETGSKTRPNGGMHVFSREDHLNNLLFRSHYCFGLGGSFMNVWVWRDPWEVIFPWGLMRPDGVAKDSLKLYRNTGLLFNTITPVYKDPSIYYLLPDRHRLSYPFLNESIYNGMDELMNCHVDFNVINEANLEKLPVDAKAIIYPLPYRPDESVIEKLKDFVNKGGSLYFSGDISYDESFKRTRTTWLNDLAGIEFKGGIYDGLPDEIKADTGISPETGSGLMEWKGAPCLEAEAVTAKVLASSSRGPVVFKNILGLGHVLYTTDPIEQSKTNLATSGIYRAFLQMAGINGNSISPDDPKCHVFKINTAENFAYVLYNQNAKKTIQTYKLTETSPEVSVNLAGMKSGFVNLSRLGEVIGLEAQGDVKQGDMAIINTNIHCMVFSLDGKSLSQSREFAILPMDEGIVTVNSIIKTTELNAELGELKDNKWLTLAKITPAAVKDGLKFEIDSDQNLNIILVSAGDPSSAREKIMKVAGF